MSRLRVLIASDDDDMRKHMVVLLCRNYQVVGTVTNRELVHAAIGVRPDVIVCGISEPRIDGLAARQRLIKQGTFIPFVFVSRESSEEIINMQEWNFGTALLVMAGWASLLYRIRAEEQMLSHDPAWSKYVASVRYRLLPAVW